ncbi:MAG TPA: hypothetical protein VFQ44_14375 [Streptosporangiaceae bacterium]|nr:hypothetical protein [Streptosporangiaceae bacterium]
MAELPFMVLPKVGSFQYTGYLAGHLLNDVDLSWVAGLVVSGVLYLVLSITLDTSAELAALGVSDRESQATDLAAGGKASLA